VTTRTVCSPSCSSAESRLAILISDALAFLAAWRDETWRCSRLPLMTYARGRQVDNVSAVGVDERHGRELLGRQKRREGSRMIHFRDLCVCAAMLTCSLTSASATIRIVKDHGGDISKYLHAFAKVRSTGERVVIDGDCMSACTMVLGLVPSKQICVTRRARFGFHAASMLKNDGHLVTSALGTEALLGIYPASVRRWIIQHGGLTKQMTYMEGRPLDGIVATCDLPIRTGMKPSS
jgi:hypothetical protein